MGIAPTVGYWMYDLYRREVFDGCTSVIEIGPSHFWWDGKGLQRFLKKYISDETKRKRFLGQLTMRKGRLEQDIALGFYELLGITDYEAIDFGDAGATLKHDLNFPLELKRQYDVVADFGTIEHIFNIGEAFRTVHNLVRSGGVMVHGLPTFGGYYHGFYNIHAWTFKSLAYANDYEMIDLFYVHDIEVERARVEKRDFAKFEDIKNKEVRLQHVKFFFNYFSSVAKRKERTNSYILAAFRKKTDREFVFPQQMNKYAIDSDTQLWDATMRQQNETVRNSMTSENKNT